MAALRGKEVKVNQVKLSTFKNWGLKTIFGIKTIERDDGIWIVTIHCNTCREYIDNIVRNDSVRGQAQIELRRMADGTSFFSKHTAHRHLDSKVSFLPIYIDDNLFVIKTLLEGLPFAILFSLNLYNMQI